MRDIRMEIAPEELIWLMADGARVIDLRREGEFDHGHIRGAENIRADEILKQDIGGACALYCANGEISKKICEILVERGEKAYYLGGGYGSWITYSIDHMPKSTAKDVEEGIRGKFATRLFTKFAKSIKEYDLLSEGDKVAVCISGGKDSMLMAKLFQELKRHNKLDFGLEFLVMDPGYSPANRTLIERNAEILGIPIKIFGTDIFDNVFAIEKSPCYVCARMRRGNLYAKAKELGCNKIALGHHYDDVIETILMGMLFGGQVQTMMPKVKSKNFEGMQLIRPMYLVREADIKAWRDFYGLNFLQCACRFTEENYGDIDASSSKRLQVKNLIAELKIKDPQIEQNIFKSVENVNLATVIAYKDKAGERHSFLDDYEEGE